MDTQFGCLDHERVCASHQPRSTQRITSKNNNEKKDKQEELGRPHPSDGERRMIQHDVIYHNGSEALSSWCHHNGARSLKHNKKTKAEINKNTFGGSGKLATSVLKGSIWNLVMCSHAAIDVSYKIRASLTAIKSHTGGTGGRARISHGDALRVARGGARLKYVLTQRRMVL